MVNFLLRDRVFFTRDGQLGFHEFNKVFFPYATLMNMEVEDAVKRQESNNKARFLAMGSERSEIKAEYITAKLRAADKQLRKLLS